MLNGWRVENYSTLGYKYVFIDNLLPLFGGAFILHVKGRRRLCYWEELVALYRALAEIILMDVAVDAVLCRLWVCTAFPGSMADITLDRPDPALGQG